MEKSTNAVSQPSDDVAGKKQECESPDFEKSTDVEMSECIPEVFAATWLHEDHIDELTQILRGVEADRVENCLMQYVEENIEPAGWKAVWQHPEPSSSSEQLLDQTISQTLYSQLLSTGPLCRYVVEVMNVNWEKLAAEVKYCKAFHKDLSETELDDEITVPLMQLYPLAVQENDALDIATTAEVIEQVRFFYNHIWQAWDLEEESCCYDRHLIATRLKLYQDIETGCIPSAIGSELRGIVKKANSVQCEIERMEKVGNEDDVDQEKVSSLIRLHKVLEKLKARFDLLQEPVVRELSSIHQSVDLSWSVFQRCSTAKVKVVIDCLNIEVLSNLSNIQDLMKKLPQVPDDATCQSFPTLQHALDASRKSDVVVILPGVHHLQHLGLISYGGTLIGLGDNVVIEGTKDAGDVLLDISGDFCLQNLMLKPASDQVGVVHHSGNLLLNKVELQGGLTGVIGLGKTHSQIEESFIRGCSDKGVDFREGSFANIDKSFFFECSIGIQVEDNSKVGVCKCTIKNNSFGILVMCPVDSDVSCFKDIPKEALLKSLLSEFEGNTLCENKEDADVVTAVRRPSVEDLHSPSARKGPEPCGSTCSLDSGLECIESK